MPCVACCPPASSDRDRRELAEAQARAVARKHRSIDRAARAYLFIVGQTHNPPTFPGSRPHAGGPGLTCFRLDLPRDAAQDTRAAG